MRTYLDYYNAMMSGVKIEWNRFTLMDLITLSRIPEDVVTPIHGDVEAFSRTQKAVLSELESRENKFKSNSIK